MVIKFHRKYIQKKKRKFEGQECIFDFLKYDIVKNSVSVTFFKNKYAETFHQTFDLKIFSEKHCAYKKEKKNKMLEYLDFLTKEYTGYFYYNYVVFFI